MNSLLRSLLEQGAYTVFQGLPGQVELVSRARGWILESVGDIVSPQAQADLDRRGLQWLHEHLSTEDIGALRNQVMPRLRGELLDFAWRLGKDVFGLVEEFFVDDYLILRVNFPYELAVRASARSENPGIGRTAPEVAGRPGSLNRRDPRYNPQGYHMSTPPASWAHGPHKDTWTGHSRDGVNLWWAITEVVQGNSMVFYPGTFRTAFEVDPSSLYVRAGQRIGKPLKMALRSGELLVFNPELLHATHLNTSGVTRLAMSARINAAPPVFDPGCFYAREFWHSSASLARGDHSSVIQFHRDKHLRDTPQDMPVVRAEPTHAPEVKAVADGDAHVLVSRHELNTGDRWSLRLPDGSLLALWRSEPDWYATSAQCPHLPVPLLDGHLEGTRLYCPAHAVEFALESGRSECTALRLAVFPVTAGQEFIRISLKP